MSRIRGRDTAPELMLRRAIWAAGLRYRIKSKLLGRPDIIFISARVAVFVDGCFWHGCRLHMVKPKTRASFWAQKISRTRARDAYVNVELKRQGWTVLRFWEHEIEAHLPRSVLRINQIVERRLKQKVHR